MNEQRDSIWVLILIVVVVAGVLILAHIGSQEDPCNEDKLGSAWKCLKEDYREGTPGK